MILDTMYTLNTVNMVKIDYLCSTLNGLNIRKWSLYEENYISTTKYDNALEMLLKIHDF